MSNINEPRIERYRRSQTRHEIYDIPPVDIFEDMEVQSASIGKILHNIVQQKGGTDKRMFLMIYVDSGGPYQTITFRAIASEIADVMKEYDKISNYRDVFVQRLELIIVSNDSSSGDDEPTTRDSSID